MVRGLPSGRAGSAEGHRGGLRRLIRCASRALCVAALAGAASAAAPPAQLPWAPGLTAAFEEAARRKVPVLVVLNMDGEGGNERMVAEVYTDAALRDAAKKVVPTVASLGTHPETDDPAAGRKVCSKFGRVACADHRATEETVRKEWLGRGPKDDVESPRHIFCAPDGRRLFERVWTVEADELVRLIDRAVAACAPETLASWDTTEARLVRTGDPLPCVRTGALRDLVALRDPAVDAKLLDLVRRTEDAGVARDALTALGADPLPHRAEGVRKLLTSPSAVVRAHAAAAVAAVPCAASHDAIAAAFAKEKQSDVKCVLLRASAVSGGDPAKTREFLLKHAKAGDAALRTHAVVALGAFASDVSVFDALHRMPGNDKLPASVRTAACWTLGLTGRSEVAVELRPLTEERDESLRRAAEAAIRRSQSAGPDPNYARWRNWLAPLDVALPDDGVR